MSVHAGAEHNHSTPVTSPPGAGDDTIGSGGYATDVTPAWGEGAPEWVDVLISLVAAGQMWPEGSEKDLAALAVAFDDLSQAALAGQDVSSRATMLGGWSGASADAFREHTDELASGETGLAGMAQAARAYALQQDSFARATQYGKLSINVGYWITVSAAAVGVMASFLTAGATTPLLAAYAQRLRTFLNQVFGSLERAAGAGRGLTTVAPKLAAVQTAQFGGRQLGQGLLARAVTSHMLRELPEEVGEGLLMDGLAQHRQMELGTRTSWDTRMTAANVLGDATGALLASRVAPAVSKYVSGLPGLRHLDTAAGDAGGLANVLMRYPTKAASAAATNALVSAPAGMISNGVVYGTWQLPTMEGLVGSMAAGAGRVGTVSPLSTDVLSALANPSTALARAESTALAQDPTPSPSAPTATPSPSAPTAGSGQGGSTQNTATHGAGGVIPMTTIPPTPAGDAQGTGSLGTPQRSGPTPTPAGAPTASAPTASAPTASAPTASAPTASAPTASAQTGSAPTGAPPSTTSSGTTQAGATPQGSAPGTASSGTAQAGAASQGAPPGTASGGTAQAGTAPQGSAPGTASGGTAQAGAASQGAGSSSQSAAAGAPGGSPAQTSPIGAAAGTPVAGTGAPTTPATAEAGPTAPATAPTAPATAGAGPTAPAAAVSVPTVSGAPNATGPGVEVEGGELVPSKEALALALSGAGTPSVPRLEGIGPEVASDIDQALRELARDYPDLTRALGAVSTTDPHGNFVTQPDLVAYAVMDGGERGIHLNPVAMADQAEAGRVEEATGWTVPGGGSVRGVLYHEVGEHIADRIISDPDARTALNATVSAALGRPYDVIGVHDQATVTAVESRLSTYGATTPRDLIAEAFTEYRASATPRPLARAVGELIDRLHTTPAHRTQDTAPTTRSREEIYARRRGPSDDPEADPDLWALRAMDGRMSESRYRDEDAERQAGKILQRMASTWGREGTQWLLDTFQARSPYVRDGIAWAARQNGVAGPSGEQQSMAQTSRPLGQSGRSGQSGQPQEAAYQAENLYDSQADRRHWKDVMREADHLAHQYTAADRNQDADAFQDAIDDAQAFVRRHGLADAGRTPWYKFKGAAEMDDWMAFREREDTSTGIGFISEILLYDFDLEPDDLKGTGAAGQSGTKGYEPPISDHDDFGKVNVERRTKVPLAGLRPQRVEDYDKASQPLSEEHKEAMRKAYGELRKFIDDLGSREIRFGDLLAIINKVNPTGHNRNCPETSLAIDDILRGKPAVAGPLNAAPVPVIRTTMGRRAIEKHMRLGSLKKVAKILLNEGPGSRGVVVGYSGSGIGHVCNVLNVNGHIYYADGQHQRVYIDRHPMEGRYREYDFFQTR
ncbi:toxin glutamine deamidase domain-containing protein [Nonomuraea angiospora]|uniref:toxin glutamine deamidase domain-containing protein n=1 Tax=Nonomuraea angiospora TaxID=46172 RepID=UPI0033D0B466